MHSAINAATQKIRIMNMPKIFKSACLITALIPIGCVNMKALDTATERTLCRVWGESLPTRSRMDTAQTQTEIAAAYADFGAACPLAQHLVP